MSRNGSGIYSLPSNSWNPATNGTPATAADWQTLINDVAAALTQSLSKDGQTPLTGNLAAGGNKVTGLAAASANGDAVRFEQIALAALGAAASGANADITSLSGVTSINGGQLAGLRNRIINGNFGVNQRTYVSGAAVGTGLYGHDRWKMAASADTYTFSTTANVTTVTIPASKVLRQVIEGLNLESGTYTLSWDGTAQGKIGAGSYGTSGITGVIVGGTNTTIEFGPGTVSKVQLEFGSTATVFEQRPIGMELALCQRYYYRVFPNAVSAQLTTAGNSSSTTVAFGFVSFPTEMRIAPTALEQSGAANQYAVALAGSTVVVCSAVPAHTTITTKNVAAVLATVASGLTANLPYSIRTDATNGASAYLGWSAEL